MSETNTVSPLRQRMIEDMAARKLNPHTQRSHISSCKRFAAWLKRSPDTATAEEVRRFQLHLIERGSRAFLTHWNRGGSRHREYEEVVMSSESLIVILAVGLIAGWLAGQIVQGTGYGIINDLIIGVVGSFIGGWLLPQLGVHFGVGIVAAIINATIGALLLLLVLRLVRGGGRWRGGWGGRWGWRR